MKILVADAEPQLSYLMEETLKHNNYLVEQAQNGKEAYAMASSHIYDCIIIDMAISGKDGLEVINELRTSKVMTPILLLAADDSLKDNMALLDTGADDFIAKPFSMNELVIRVGALCSRATHGTPDALIFNDLVLNCGTYEICCGNKSMRITNKEFQLLELLMRNPQTLFSTESMMERFWNWDHDVAINVVWTNIGYLRRKIESLGANAEIRSFRGRGYQITDAK